MMDNQVIIAIGLWLFGTIIGSFVGASVWRLRARQLHEDAKSGEKLHKVDALQVAKLQKKSLSNDRSVCLHCGHQLAWYDLVPLISWLSLLGKCRYCRHAIGWLEPAVELGTAAFFVVSYLFWPHLLASNLDVFQFIIWLVAGVGLAILFVYDMKWYLLPNAIVFPLIGLGFVYTFTVLIEHQFALSQVASILYGCAILSGLYYLIYVISQYKWVGFGDVKLGLALALLLADWRLSLLTLFLANLIGTIVYLPLIIGGSVKRATHIPFGPLLISGFLLSGLFGSSIIDWYLTITLGIV